MNFKLDENVGERGADLLRAAGHDVATVRQQNLIGAKDESLFNICANEGRVLLTLDHDFGHVLRFPPERSSGIINSRSHAPGGSGHHPCAREGPHRIAPSAQA